MPQQLLCVALEKIANKALSLNTQRSQALETLLLKTLTIQLSELNFPLSITFQSNSVMVTSLTSMSDCSIQTSLSTLNKLKKEQQLTELIKQGELDIQGDIKVAQQVAHIAEHLKIDWESEIALHIGDVATYKLGQAGKFLAQKLKFAQVQISQDSSEWLLHEARLVVSASEINHHSRQVDAASKATLKLEQRIKSLTQKLLSAQNLKA